MNQNDVNNAVNNALSLRPVVVSALIGALGVLSAAIFQPLSGDLSGTMPNPTIAAGAVTASKMAAGAAVANGALSPTGAGGGLTGLNASALTTGTVAASLLPSPTVYSFTGDGTTTSFTYPAAIGSTANLIVNVGGVPQFATANYTSTATVLTFTGAPPAGAVITATVGYLPTPGFAPSAFTDTTNAGNITQGTIALPRLPTIPFAQLSGVLSPTGSADQTTLSGRTQTARLNDFPIKASDFGENCNGSFDNHAAYTAAAAAAVASGRPLEFGSGACIVLSTVVINGPIYDFRGKGKSATNIQERFNGPLFQFNITQSNSPGGMQNFRFHDMTVSAYFSPVPSPYPSLTTAFDIIGDNQSFVQHGGWDNINFQGFYAGITFEKTLPSTPDSFGLEALTDWLSFDHLTFQQSTQDGQFGIWFKQGSGTGNTFSDIRTTISGSGTGASVPASAIRYDGPSTAVVGDQVVTGSHFGGVHSVFGVGTGTNYRANMSVTGSQLDAGVTTFADLPTDLPYFSRINFSGNNVGGGIQNSFPPFMGSKTDDQLVDERSAGTNSQQLGNNASQASTALFSVTTNGQGNSNFFGGTKCTITVDGLIGGVAAGITDATFLLVYAPTGFSSAVLETQTQSTASASFFTITAAVSNGTVTFSATYTAANGGNIDGAQARCQNGTYTLKRLL